MTTAHEGTPEERLFRRSTFDTVADHYDRGRPGYPAELFEDIIRITGLPTQARILEVGPGTGHATLPFARRGYLIDTFELGENLAQRWRENLASFPNAKISVGPFESASLTPSAYDLAFSASAFHWIDPATGYQLIANALRPEGWFALWWNRLAAGPEDDRVARILRPVYERYVPELVAVDVNLAEPDSISPPAGNQIADSSLFGPVRARRYPLRQTYATEEYIALLNSYSRYHLLDVDLRAQFFGELADQIDRSLNGIVTRSFVTFLYLAQPLQE